MDFPFIYGAQYYRAPTPHEAYWADDLKRMADSGFNAVKFWCQWRWVHQSRDLFYFDDLDKLMDLAAENKLMATINVIFDVAPNWIYDAYPDCRMITASGEIVQPQATACRQIGGYPGPCYNHPESTDAKKHFLRIVASRYANHPAMSMWDVWNEPESNYLHRDPIPENLLCYCSRCHRQFIKWLQTQYSSIDHLNVVWGRCYRNWNEVELPRGQSVFTDMIDWRLFSCDLFAREAKWRIQTVKSIDTVHPVYLHPVPNTMTCFNAITGVDDFRMADSCDCFGGTTNGVPVPTIQTVSSAQGRICYNVESHLRYGNTAMHPKHLTVVDFANAFVPQIGLGIRGFLHWQYRPETLGAESPAWGLLDIDGKPGTTHDGASEFWQKIRPFAAKLINAPIEAPQVAILKSTANEIFHWCMDGTLDPLAEDIEGYTWLLYNSNVRLSYVDERIVKSGLPSNVKILIMPDCYAMYQPTADAIIKWVLDGGILICEAHTGGYNLTTGRHNTDLPGMGMADAFGIREINSTSVVHLGIHGASDLPGAISDDVQKAIAAFGLAGGMALPLITNDDRILWGWSRFTEIEGDGLQEFASLPGHKPSVGFKKVGTGAVYYIGTLAGKLLQNTGSPGLEKLINAALDYSGIAKDLECISWAPKAVRVDKLHTNDGTAYTVYNHGSEEVEFNMPVEEPCLCTFGGLCSTDGNIHITLDPGSADLVAPCRWLDGDVY